MYRLGMIIVYNGNRKILVIFKQYVYRVHVYGHRIFFFIIGTNVLRSEDYQEEGIVFFFFVLVRMIILKGQ